VDSARGASCQYDDAISIRRQRVRRGAVRTDRRAGSYGPVGTGPTQVGTGPTRIHESSRHADLHNVRRSRKSNLAAESLRPYHKRRNGWLLGESSSGRFCGADDQG
jgi:hypothetical protein